MLTWTMKNNGPATHVHKRAGAVVLLESTAILAKVLAPGGDEFWVKLTDLTQVVQGEAGESQTGKRQLGKRDRPTASSNSQYRVVRAA